MHSPDLKREYPLPDEAATAAFGAALAAALQPGLVIRLDGDLGAGKTTLVRAVLRALGHQGPVKSPTYTLVELYEVSSLYLYHFDFYRFNEPSEFLDAGLGEYFRDDSVCFVEWPDKAAGYLPPVDFSLTLQTPPDQPDSRLLSLLAHSERGRACLSRLTFPAATS